jgi:hypothetical protein
MAEPLHHDSWWTPSPSETSENTPLLRAPKKDDDARKIFREELVKLTKSGLPIFGYVVLQVGWQKSR